GEGGGAPGVDLPGLIIDGDAGEAVATAAVSQLTGAIVGIYPTANAEVDRLRQHAGGAESPAMPRRHLGKTERQRTVVWCAGDHEAATGAARLVGQRTLAGRAGYQLCVDR